MVQVKGILSLKKAKETRQPKEPTFPEEKRWHPLTVSKMKGLRSGGAGRWDCDKDCFTFLISTRHKARSSPGKTSAHNQRRRSVLVAYECSSVAHTAVRKTKVS